MSLNVARSMYWISAAKMQSERRHEHQTTPCLVANGIFPVLETVKHKIYPTTAMF